METSRDSSGTEQQLRGAKIVSFGGIFFFVLATAIFGITAYSLFRPVTRLASWEGYVPETLLTGIGVFSAVLGVSLLRAGGLIAVEPNRVINAEDWDAMCEKVTAGDEEAVSQYIRLSGLTGFTGIFTKLGLTGLPLATIGLTLFFSLLFFSSPAFLDLAKLTLGAFIGSFVQKQVGTPSRGKLTLPGGETFRFSSHDPPPS